MAETLAGRSTMGKMPDMEFDKLMLGQGTGEQPIERYADVFGTATLTATATNRGRLYYTEGTVDVADKLYIVMKGADNNYSAVQVSIG
ncbi:hypothetical protein ES703_09096 [subsurface metagenome]